MIDLIIKTGEGTRFVHVASGEWVVGRSSSSDIRIDHAQISRRHVVLTVSESGVRVANESRFGTKLDGVPIGDTVQWGPSSVIQLSKDISLTWRNADQNQEGTEPKTSTRTDYQDQTQAPATVAAEEEDPDDLDRSTVGASGSGMSREEEIRGATSTGIQSSAGLSATRATPAPEVEDNSPRLGEDDPGTFAGESFGDDEDEWGHTRELHTRLAVAEDLEHLRDINIKSGRKRIFGYVAVAACVLVLSILFWPRNVAQEEMIEWPEDIHGNSLDAVFDVPGGGFRLIVPDTAVRVVSDEPHLLMVRCSIGRDQDIPLHVSVEEVEVVDYWRFSLHQLVDQWARAQAEASGDWLFDDPISSAMFLGGRSGVPFIFVRYTQSGGSEGERAGTARFFRSGKRFLVVRTEVPLRFRPIASDILSYFFVSMSDDFIDRAWEPVVLERSGTAYERLQEALFLGFERDNPVHYPEVIRLFREALTLAARDGDVPVLSEAVSRLAQFRQKQHVFFNQQLIARTLANSRGDQQQAAAIQRLCMGVFSDLDDARFYHVRRW